MKVLYTDLIYKIFSSAVKNVVHNFTETNSLDMGYIFGLLFGRLRTYSLGSASQMYRNYHTWATHGIYSRVKPTISNKIILKNDAVSQRHSIAKESHINAATSQILFVTRNDDILELSQMAHRARSLG
jgi:hypothetical protein